jgi:nitroimidazol reductase NimA-like FMN-containing flavoprotein (pyridoxamine 5'-phosphate oxidase superfamily)
MELDNVEEDIEALLKNQRIGYLCTADARGMPHVTPMFFLYDFMRHELYFVTDRKSKKASNLLEVSNLAFTVDIRDRENPFNNRGVLLRGELLKLTDLSFELAEKSKTALKMFSEKYRGIIAEEPIEPESKAESEAPMRAEMLRKVDLEDYVFSEKSPYDDYYALLFKREENEIIRKFHDVLITAKVHQMTYWKGPFWRVFKFK